MTVYNVREQTQEFFAAAEEAERKFGPIEWVLEESRAPMEGELKANVVFCGAELHQYVVIGGSLNQLGYR